MLPRFVDEELSHRTGQMPSVMQTVVTRNLEELLDMENAQGERIFDPMLAAKLRAHIVGLTRVVYGWGFADGQRAGTGLPFVVEGRGDA